MPTLQTTVQAVTEALPLLDKDTTVGSPTNGQFVIGRNTAADIRKMMLRGALLPAAATTTNNVRPGVLPNSYSAALGTYTDLRVSAQSTANNTFRVEAGRAYVNKTGQGPYELWQDAQIATITPAAADAQARYDIVYLKLYDGGGGDSTSGPHGPYVEYVKGDASASPSMATARASVPADCVELAAVLRPAGNSVITDANITDLRHSTGPLGAIRPVLPGDITDSTPGYMVGERRSRRAASGLTAIGCPDEIIDWWDGSAWRGATRWSYNVPSNLGGDTNFNAATEVTLAAVTIPDPGFSYVVQASGALEWTVTGTSVTGDLQRAAATLDSTAATSGIIVYGDALSLAIPAGFTQPTVAVRAKRTGTLTGSHTIRLIARNYSGTWTHTAANSITTGLLVEIIPT